MLGLEGLGLAKHDKVQDSLGSGCLGTEKQYVNRATQCQGRAQRAETGWQRRLDEGHGFLIREYIREHAELQVVGL